MTAPSVYTRRKPLSLAGARLPQTRNGLEKSGERASDTRIHTHTAVKEKGYRRRRRMKKERGRGGLYRALCDVKEHRFSGSRCRVFDIEMGEDLSPLSCLADVDRFNPPRTRSTWYQTRWQEKREGEKESSSSYFVDTLQRVVLQGDSQTVRAAQFSFSTSIPLPPPLFRLHGGWPRVSSARVIDHGRFRLDALSITDRNSGRSDK